MKYLIFATILVLFVTGIASAYATEPVHVDSKQERDQIFHQMKFSAVPGTNYAFSIIITPTGAKQNNVILSPDNLTAIQNNVAFFTACGTIDNGLCQPPILTTAQPTTNYCPIAKFILVNQDGYLNKTYTVTSNGTVLKDLTPLIYPSYCFAETGNNPVNGQGPGPQPIPIPSSDLTIATDKKEYGLGDKIIISGTSPHQVPDITLMVISPNNSIVTIDQTTAISGIYSDSLQTGGTLWAQTGSYTIKATQGTESASTQITIANKVPEFPIAAELVIIASISFVVFLSRMRK